MDKTSVIVVSACAVLLAANIFFQGSEKQTPPPAANASAVSAAEPVAAPLPQSPEQTPQTAQPDQPDQTQQTPEQAASSEQPQAQEQAQQGPSNATSIEPPSPALYTAPTPRILATLTSKDENGKEIAKYSFQDIGGSIQSVEMLGKAIDSTKPELHGNVKINDNVLQGIGALVSGLSSNRAPVFDNTVYELETADNEKVVLKGRNHWGCVIRKTYSLKPLHKKDGTLVSGNAYMLKLDIELQNKNPRQANFDDWGIYAGGMYQVNPDESSRYTYYIRLEDGDFEKESIGSFSPFFGSKKARIYETELDNIEWAGLMNQYYSTLLIARDNASTKGLYAAPAHYKLPVTHEEVEGLELALALPSFSLQPPTEQMQAGGYQKFSYEIFTGPKLNLMLSDMAGKGPEDVRMIDRIMDYGWLYFLSYPMNWLINIFHSWFGNWGWAIVAMTFVVRLLIWPLYRKSYMSMKRMSLLQPKMQELKQKYPDNQQKVSMEMMNLYREYGISPMGGCLPMLLQIPIFFAFFYVLQTAAEFRGAPFIGWVTDLSQMDTVCTIPLGSWDLPINILPIIMAISMVVQMKMSPSAGDPTQQKIMKFMPILFFLFCYTYASALALYWTTTNIISIIQTLIIRRMPMPVLEKAHPKKGGKKSFFDRMVEAQKAALAEQQRQAQMRNVTRK